jgi:hypothetical protein
MPIQTPPFIQKIEVKKTLLSLLNIIKMISIHYVIRQISPNLFKVDATTFQRATCRSSMMLIEVSSL